MKIETIIISGCSFVHGYDLCYEKFGLRPHTFSHLVDGLINAEQRAFSNGASLPGQLARIFDCKVINLAMAGESNDYIANSLVTYLNKNKKSIDPATTLIIAGWTEPERWPFFLDRGVLNTCVSQVTNYIKIVKAQEMNANTERRVADYEQLLGIEKLWHENEAMSYTGYFHHAPLIVMLQQYAESLGLRLCCFNSLQIYPLSPTFKSSYHSYDPIINWNNWYPAKNQRSYDWNWDQHMNKHMIPKTSSHHPSLLAVELFSQQLSDFIKNNY